MPGDFHSAHWSASGKRREREGGRLGVSCREAGRARACACSGVEKRGRTSLGPGLRMLVRRLLLAGERKVLVPVVRLGIWAGDERASVVSSEALVLRRASPRGRPTPSCPSTPSPSPARPRRRSRTWKPYALRPWLMSPSGGTWWPWSWWPPLPPWRTVEGDGCRRAGARAKERRAASSELAGETSVRLRGSAIACYEVRMMGEGGGGTGRLEMVEMRLGGLADRRAGPVRAGWSGPARLHQTHAPL